MGASLAIAKGEKKVEKAQGVSPGLMGHSEASWVTQIATKRGKSADVLFGFH